MNYEKNIKNSIRIMAIAISGLVMPLVACNIDDNEMANEIGSYVKVENPATLAAYAVSLQGTQSDENLKKAVFTEDDIEWFDLNTRELRFSITSKTIQKRMKSLSRIEFRLGDDRTEISWHRGHVISRHYS